MVGFCAGEVWVSVRGCVFVDKVPLVIYLVLLTLVVMYLFLLKQTCVSTTRRGTHLGGRGVLLERRGSLLRTRYCRGSLGIPRIGRGMWVQELQPQV